jgi:hypothetical protein
LSMAELVEANYPDDMMMRISVDNPHGHGRPVDVYFLWSQRFDVKPIYGVGPELPDSKAMLGVVQPDPEYQTGGYVSPEVAAEVARSVAGAPCVFPDPNGPTVWDDLPEPEAEEDPPIQTMEDWQAEHADILSLAAQGMKPTPEQFALLRSTCPEGPQAANVAVAMAGKGLYQDSE